MNIYLIKNNYNIQNNINPKYYIGSDTKDRLEYFGSSKFLTKDIKNIGLEYFSKEILWSGDYKDLINMGYNRLVELENIIQKEYNVLSEEYYNKCFANKEFATEGYANYFYVNDPNKKIVSLPTNHQDVINGLAVGMNKNKIVSDETKNKLKEKRKYRIFTEETKQKLRKPRKNTENFKKPKSEEHKRKLRKPKSEEHKQKILESSHKKKVIQYSLDKEKVNEYNSLTDAAKSLGRKNYKTVRGAISECCRGLIKKVYGFIWEFDPKIDPVD